MSDKFSQFVRSLTSPPFGGFAVSPSDSDNLPSVTRAINVGVAGNLRVTMLDDTQVTLFLQAGGVFPLRVKRIWATDTTAAEIVGLY